MKLDILKEKMAGKFGKLAFKLKENSPGLFLIGGIGFIVGGTILACKATTRLSDILDEHEKDMDDIHEASENPDFKEIYVESGDAKHETIKVYSRTIGKIAKGYAVPTFMMAGGIAMIIKSHNDLKGRYLGALSAFNALSTSFNEYRERVREELGEEEELHYYHGTKRITEKKKIIDENGKKKTETVVVDEYDDILPSPYAKFFDETNEHWCSERQYGPNATEYSMIFLRQTQSWANRILEVRGYIFLNEVYQALGLDMTDIGAITGWVKDGEHDDFVDFGLYDINKEATRRFVNGTNKHAILLDFNVDGNIIGKIDYANRTLKRGF